MMKNKIITVLLLVSAGFGQNAQAMGGARNFAKKVFFSKTAAVAGALAGVNGALQYKARQDLIQKIENAETLLSEESQKEVQTFFELHGYSPVIKDYPGDCPAVFKNGDYTCLLLDRRSRCVLDRLIFNKRLRLIFNEKMKIKYTLNETLEKKHILDGALCHEVDHLKHPDMVERQIEQSIVGPTAILAGKIVRIAGGSKKLAVAAGIFSFYGLFLSIKQRAQQQEERCDRNAADTIEHAENLAFYLKETGLPEDKEVQSIVIVTEFVSKLNWSEKNKEQVVAFASDFAWLLQDHPRTSKRIAYLEKIAAQKRSEENK